MTQDHHPRIATETGADTSAPLYGNPQPEGAPHSTQGAHATENRRNSLRHRLKQPLCAFATFAACCALLALPAATATAQGNAREAAQRASEAAAETAALPALDAEQRVANAAFLSATQKLRGNRALLKEGDTVPEFVLYNQNGQPVLVPAQWKGKFVVVSFIFTRCQVANMCPAASARMAQLQRQLREDGLSDHVELVTITFDPRYDTPSVLRQYAQMFGMDTATNYSLLTGSPELTEALLRRFGLLTVEQNGTISHTMTTSLIAPDGTLAARQRGADWSNAPFLEQIRSAVAAGASTTAENTPPASAGTAADNAQEFCAETAAAAAAAAAS